MLEDSIATQALSRIPTAHLSVSLRHGSQSPASSTCSLRAQAARGKETRQSSLIWRISPISRTSEESNEIAESHIVPAEMWFEQSNKDVGGRLGPQFLDNEPPFFLQNQALPYPEYGTKAEELGNVPRTFHYSGSQFATGLVQGDTNGSSIDDFRSVIDDLTIQNRKLKERLRKHERSYDAHLEKDKLFEVKFHGLDPVKKRELEETLHAFASSISKDESTNTSISHLASNEVRHVETSPRHGVKIPSSTSTNSRLVDSAYASLSRSGPTSSSTANAVGLDKKGSSLPAASKMGNIQSFLDDIPQGLLPKYPTVMTERGKKKLVVRRLEQLFTGKLKVPRGSNSQSQQQQEVSNSAARDDRQAIERCGQHVSVEGIREAHILDTEMELERTKLQKLPGQSSADSSTASQAECGERNTEAPPPDQRPTRPLDLDPDRAQVPSENIDYIRHLGISTPLMIGEDCTHFVLDDNHGWVYLNLLINMAQLHIINVTPDFIRSAVTELSTKFQLSPDGRKLRWRGGTEGTVLSSDSGADNSSRPNPNDSDSLDEGSRGKRKFDRTPPRGSAVELNSKQGRLSPTAITGLGRSQPPRTIERRYNHPYKPLFAHHSNSEDDSMSLDLDDNVSQGSYVLADDIRTAPTSSGARATGRRSHSGLSTKRKRDEGAIAFYSGAPFCTDLSGDQENTSTPLHASAVDTDGFSNHSHDAIGCRPRKLPRPLPARTPSGSLLPLRPFKDFSLHTGPMVESETRSQIPELVVTDEDSNLNFSPQWTSGREQRNKGLVILEACGLGGTRPADHFAYTVETRFRKLNQATRLKLSKYPSPGRRSQRFLRTISKTSLDPARGLDGDDYMPPRLSPTSENILATSESVAPVEWPLPLQGEILSTRYQEFEPSDLPPPATYHGPFSSSTDWSNDSYSSDNEEEHLAYGDRRSHLPARTLNSASSYYPMDLAYIKSTENVSDTDDSDTFSIDILAHAREVDPDGVTAKEREYNRDTLLQLNDEPLATADSADSRASLGFSL